MFITSLFYLYRDIPRGILTLRPGGRGNTENQRKFGDQGRQGEGIHQIYDDRLVRHQILDVGVPTKYGPHKSVSIEL